MVVGTGPGSFTGLRVGMATAKTLAYSLACPIVGVSTAEALALGATARGSQRGASPVAVVLPAGPSARYVARVEVGGGDRLPRAAADAELVPVDRLAAVLAGEAVVAVDLDEGELDAAAHARGLAAVGGLPAALVTIGAERLAARHTDDVATLVPVYVTLPRGVSEVREGVTWSHGLP